MNSFSQKFFQEISKKETSDNGAELATKKMRSTLCIKNTRCTLYKGKTELEEIENRLKKEARAILEECQDSSVSYNDQFKSTVITRKLVSCLLATLNELRAGFIFPTQVDPVFEKICDKTHRYLEDTIGPHAVKFNEAYHKLMEPKENLPKVSLPPMK